MNKNTLIACGIDYDNGLERFLNDNELYEQVIKLFLEDQSFENAKKALQRKDYKELFNQIHTLKGVCGNISIINLYQDCCLLVNTYRSNDYNFKKMNQLFNKIEKDYIKAINGIKEG